MAGPDRIINFHGHLHGRDDVDALVRLWEAHNIRRFVCLCIGGPDGLSKGGEYYGADDLLPWMKKYPDMIIGFADVNAGPQPSTAWEVEKRKEQGFAGLKFIWPSYPYNDERYFPIYEAAERLGMPVMFHTGYVASRAEDNGSVDSLRMYPGCFDRIARAFPRLTLIGAHLGGPWHDMAQNMALSHSNVYFDISGGSGRRPHLSRLKRSLAPFPGANWDDPEENLAIPLFAKLVFGTDNPPPAVWVPAAIDIMDYLHIPADVRQRFWWDNAARILGIEE